MKIFITKASKDYWYQIKEFETIEDIYKYILVCKHGFVIEENNWTTEDDFHFWENMNPKDIPVIMHCPLQITIYDSWLE